MTSQKQETSSLRPHDLFEQARLLARRNRRKPKQADLCRAVSATYYALFHCLAYECANLLVGGAGAQRGMEEWTRVYRSLDHGQVKRACRSPQVLAMPQAIVDFALTFADLQERRHEADYDPMSRPKRSEVLAQIARAEAAQKAFRNASTPTRRAFCIQILFKQRP